MKLMRERQKMEKILFFSLADDTAQIDAICFSEVLESLNFDLKKGKVYNFKISVQVKNDNSRFIINNIKNLNNEINQVQNYLIKMDTKDINIKKVYNFFKNCDVGNSKLSFIIKFNDYEIFVESKKKFDLDYDFLNKKQISLQQMLSLCLHVPILNLVSHFQKFLSF